MKYLIIVILGVSSVGLSFGQAWTKLNSMPTRLTFPVVDVIDGNIHVVGGGGANGATDLHLRYTPSTDSWDTLKPVPYLAQQPGGGVINGKLHYFGGGYPNSGTRLDDHYVYDVLTNAWTKLLDVPIPRVIHKTAVLGDSIYVLSGQPDKRRVDVYNAVNKTWKQYANLPDNNFWYAGITTYDDKIYRFGGGGSISATNVAHVYNPGSDNWTSLSPLPKALHAPDAQVLGDSIFITGGYSSSTYLSGVWIYDIAKDSYSQGPYLNSERSYHAMVRIGECIYSLGGNNNSNADSTAVSLLRYCRGDDFASIGLVDVMQRHVSIIDEHYTLRITPISGETAPLEVTVYSLLGHRIFQTQRPSDGSNQIVINKNEVILNKGIYLCNVRQGASQAQLKFIVY